MTDQMFQSMNFTQNEDGSWTRQFSVFTVTVPQGTSVEDLWRAVEDAAEEMADNYATQCVAASQGGF